MRVIRAVCEPLLIVHDHCIVPDARRVAPIRACVLCLCLVVAFSGSVQCLRFVLAFCACVQWQRDLYHTTRALLTEYLTSYTNTSQFIDYQYSIQCKMLPISPTRNLHNPHAATRHKHGRTVSRHREAEKSVAPTDFSAPLCRIIYCIRPNRLRGC